MPQWHVNDVMTTEVVTAREDTPVAEIMDILSTHGISAVPIVGDDDRIVGVVSQADLVAKVAAPEGGARVAPFRRRAAKGAATSARELMSTPALSIDADAPLPAAAAKMQAKKVKRLLVTGGSGQLVGILSRVDLLRPYGRSDAAITQDVIEHVLRRTLWIDSSQVQVQVNEGVVTLTGAVGRQTTTAIAARLTSQVPGVVSVVNKIGYDFDDSDLALSRTNRTHPFSAEPFRP